MRPASAPLANGTSSFPSWEDAALPTRFFTETYYDTAGGRLGRAGFILRRRVENGKGDLADRGDERRSARRSRSRSPAGRQRRQPQLQELLSAASAGFSISPWCPATNAHERAPDQGRVATRSREVQRFLGLRTRRAAVSHGVLLRNRPSSLWPPTASSSGASRKRCGRPAPSHEDDHRAWLGRSRPKRPRSSRLRLRLSSGCGCSSASSTRGSSPMIPVSGLAAIPRTCTSSASPQGGCAQCSGRPAPLLETLLGRGALREELSWLGGELGPCARLRRPARSPT